MSRRLGNELPQAGMAYYLKTLARAEQSPLAGFTALSRFEASVEHALADYARGDLEQDARITSGIAIEMGKPRAELLAEWTAVLRALRA